ncbi:rhomboid family intramembrane serine protease [Halospeciosus flavus]|uniref:Rhomboid family intramembrane serine protease n=1 Tax=Halospeciosus flavus TaxID=3032283 RepID=A0ABD5Z2L0_9EURY|nr:rhomboid family intramembrane serine protease [Halospeciosus flavus]
MSVPSWLAVGGPLLVAAVVLVVLRVHGLVRAGDAVLVGLPAAGLVGLALGWWVAGVSLSVALFWGVLLALVASVGVVRALDRPRGAWVGRLRRRLLFGVPWGSLVSAVGVLGFYLFVQHGLADPYRPLKIPFVSWSYLYPVGVLTAPFAHAGLGHLTGNLVGTLALAPVAEYAWSHFPTERGESAFASWRTNPYVRAALFPVGVVGVGLLTSVFSWGPIVGFSGVVFAFGGFALVRYPIVTVVALSVRGVVSTVLDALRDPVVVASASPSYGGPWWAGIAIQGHVLGLFLGGVLGALLLARRSESERPSALRLWGGAFVFAVSMSLWIVWWYRGPETYVLYRGLGVVMILGVAALLVLAVRSSDRTLLDFEEGALTRRHAAICLAFVPVLVMAGVAVPVNLVTISEEPLPNEAIHVEGYDVTYVENVPNQRVSAVPIEAFGETTQVNASGVVVRNPDRHVWTEAVSRGELAFYGTSTVKVGGVGWVETIQAHREGWVAAGGGPVYRVALRERGGSWETVFRSDPATADPTVAGRNVTLAVTNTSFRVRVQRGNETLDSAPLPAANESVSVGGLRLVREESTLYAVHNETRVQVAHEERYQ